MRVFLSARADGGFELAVRVKVGLHERHAKGATLCSDRALQPLRLEAVEHELYAFRCAPLQGGQHRVDLVGQQRDDDEIVGCLLVQCAGNLHVRPLTLGVKHPVVPLQLLESDGAGPCNDGNLVLSGTSQLKGKRASDLTRPEDGNSQRSGRG